jgi:hypothetical protein
MNVKYLDILIEVMGRQEKFQQKHLDCDNQSRAINNLKVNGYIEPLHEAYWQPTEFAYRKLNNMHKMLERIK